MGRCHVGTRQYWNHHWVTFTLLRSRPGDETRPNCKKSVGPVHVTAISANSATQKPEEYSLWQWQDRQPIDEAIHSKLVKYAGTDHLS